MQSTRLIPRLLKQSVRRYGGGEHGHHLKPATMDELPVPHGSWQENYNARQRSYNMILALGIGFSVFTITVAKTSGLVYLNYSPPKSLD